MTYEELGNILRFDLLAEASTDYWDSDDLFGYLKRAASDVASEFGFPTVIAELAVVAGAKQVLLPSGCASAQLNEVSFGSFRLVLAPVAVITEYNGMLALRFPRYYNFDPKRGDRILRFAPPAPEAGVMTVEYIVEYDPSGELLTSEPWNGAFSRFHELVAYRAAVMALEASMEDERAAAMQQRLASRYQAMALFLGKTDVAQAIAGDGVAAS